MGDEAAVEVYGEREEYYEHRYQNDAGRPGRDLGEVVELDPAEYGYLYEKQEQPQKGRERPGHLDVPVQTLVGGLVHQAYAVEVADGLDVRQDAGGYHESQHVHRYQERRTHGERHQHRHWDLGVLVQLDLHHCDLK